MLINSSMKLFRKGDTMIEVLLAITIFSMVAVAGLTIMNQGATSSQRSLEITLVRQEMDAQANTLRFMYDAALAQKSSAGYSTPDPGTAAYKWNEVLAKRKTQATAFNGMVTGERCTAYTGPGSSFNVANAFVVNPKTARIYQPNASTWGAASTYSKVRYVSASDLAISRVEGIWIEAVRKNSETSGTITTPGYTDFHIRACWSAVGQKEPAKLGTIVRLYEP